MVTRSKRVQKSGFFWWEFLSQCKILLEKIVMCVSKEIMTSILVYCHQIICNWGHFGLSISMITLIFVVNINIKKNDSIPTQKWWKNRLFGKSSFSTDFYIILIDFLAFLIVPDITFHGHMVKILGLKIFAFKIELLWWKIGSKKAQK